MTHDSRTISAVFMAVILILASGTAVSLAVTDSSTSDVGSNAVALHEQQNATVTFDDQQSDGEKLVIESVTMSEGGFVAIHDTTLLDGNVLGSVLGNSVYLEAGTHENVNITLARPLEESQTLIAMPHFDTNENMVYDFVIGAGTSDGPYTQDGEVVVDTANVTVEGAEEVTTTEADVGVETTTGEEVGVETTTEEEIDVETTTEEDVSVETTTEEAEVDVETATEEEIGVETTTEEEIGVETTTEEEEVVEETTTEEEEVDVETTTEEEVAERGEQRFVIKIEKMEIDEWSFVVGDEEDPDRTEVVSDVSVSDRRVEINLTEVLRNQELDKGSITTVDPERAEDQVSDDLETVRFVIRDVSIENVTFVITASEDMKLPEPPMTPEMDVTTVEPTTEEEIDVETTEEEDVVEETTTEEEVEVETTTEEEEVDVETTTEEEDMVEETTTEEEEVVEETTTEEEEVGVETTTEEEVVEETTTEEMTTAERESFEVSQLDAPDQATIGDTITVSALVSNPNDVESTQEVAFRLEGTVLARESVTLDANEESTVTFEIDVSDVPAGQYIHGVYTRDFGELAVIVLSESGADVETETSEETVTTTVETTEA